MQSFKWFLGLIGGVLLTGLLATNSTAQEDKIKLERITPYDTLVAGQMADLLVTGIPAPTSPTPEKSLLDYTVQVTQAGTVLPAKVKQAQPVWSFDKDSDKEKAAIAVLFTVPAGLQPGEANVTLSYRGQPSSALKLKIVERPLAPRIDPPVFGEVGRDPNTPPPRPSESARKAASYRFKLGQEAVIELRPLVDPEFPGAKVWVTFHQGSASRQVEAKTHYRPAVLLQGKDSFVGETPRYEVLVKVPADLGVGPAVMEVRTQLNGQLSEAAQLNVTLFQYDDLNLDPQLVVPQILTLMPERIGVGQALMVVVARASQLGPDPAKAVVLLGEGAEQKILKPEFNSATQAMAFAEKRDGPALLRVRVGKEFTGSVKLRVRSSARPEEAALSEARLLQIADFVLPPENVRLNESTNEELRPLLLTYEAAIKAGRTFPDYEPRARYLTIHARNLDLDPNYMETTLEQGGFKFVLPFSHYALSMPDMLAVRLPEEIKPGLLKVTLLNRGAGQTSEAVTRTVEIKTPSKQQ